MERGDRRVARTRRALHAALVQLLLEQDYDAITVGGICARADVGRSAFYQHFTCKDDLFRAGFERLRDDLDAAASSCQEADTEARLAAICDALFAHAESHAGLFRVTVSGHAGAIAARRMGAILTESLAVGMGGEDAKRASRDLQCAMAVSALLAALRWWFERGRRPGREEVLPVTQAVLAGIVSV